MGAVDVGRRDTSCRAKSGAVRIGTGGASGRQGKCPGPGTCWKSRHKCGPGPSASPLLRLCVCLCLCACATRRGCAEGLSDTKTVVHKDADFDVTYNDTVTNDVQTIYTFNHTVSRNKVHITHTHKHCRIVTDHSVN
ncbi:SID1 transmembrane family member 2-like [Arapaima gigas]